MRGKEWSGKRQGAGEEPWTAVQREAEWEEAYNLGSLCPDAFEWPKEGCQHWVPTELERPNLYTNPQTDLLSLIL